MSKLTKTTSAPPKSEKRIEIDEVARRAGNGVTRKALIRYCRVGHSVPNGQPSQKGVRLDRVRLEFDRRVGRNVFTSWEAWERFVKKINPEK